MSELVARTGRHQQRYDSGYRLVSGCIPFKFRGSTGNNGPAQEQNIEVLMINSTGGPGLVFPKGGWENDETVEEAAKREALEEAGVRGELMHFLGNHVFKSKTLQDEFSPEGLCKAAMFALLVQEELESWPEKSTRQRHWLTIPEAVKCCKHKWMREVLENEFANWQGNHSFGCSPIVQDSLLIQAEFPMLVLLLLVCVQCYPCMNGIVHTLALFVFLVVRLGHFQVPKLHHGAS